VTANRPAGAGRRRNRLPGRASPRTSRAHLRNRAACLAGCAPRWQLARFLRRQRCPHPFRTPPGGLRLFPGGGRCTAGGREPYESQPEMRVHRSVREGTESALDIEPATLVRRRPSPIDRPRSPALVSLSSARVHVAERGCRARAYPRPQHRSLAAACVAEMISVEDARAGRGARAYHACVKVIGDVRGLCRAGRGASRPAPIGGELRDRSLQCPASVVISDLATASPPPARCAAGPRGDPQPSRPQAFHSPLMDGIGAAFTAAATRAGPRQPRWYPT
jgi:hypothetical protein